MFTPLQQTSVDSNRFIRPKADGDSIKGVFAGTPLLFKQHWTDTPAGKRSVMCKGVGCDLCAQGNKPKFRFRANFIVEEGAGYAAKIYEAGRQVYDALSEQGADYDLSKTLVKITRKGAGLDTTYSLVIAPPAAQPTADKMAVIAKVVLLDLNPENDEMGSKISEEVPF